MTTCTFYKHIGLYAFSTTGLQLIHNLPQGVLESAEKLEMLRFLEHGLKIRLHETSFEVFGIDFPSDIERAERYIMARNQHTSQQQSQIL